MARLTLVVVAIASLLVSVGATCLRTRLLVPRASLDAAAEHVLSVYEEGDAVFSTPPTIVGPRERLGHLHFFSPKGLPSQDALLGLQRVHFLSLDGLGRLDALEALFSTWGTVVDRRAFPGVQVTSFANRNEHTLLFDLFADLRELTVLLFQENGTPRPCQPFVRDRWVCPPDEKWSFVGRTIVEIGGEARACVWLHPPAPKQTLVLQLPPLNSLPFDSVVVVGGFGFTSYASRRARAPVSVHLRHPNSTLFWKRFPVTAQWHEVRQVLASGAGPLELRITTTNNGAAHFCGQLRVFGGAM